MEANTFVRRAFAFWGARRFLRGETGMDTNEHVDTLTRIEATIRKGEGTAITARWESGHYLNTLKAGKKQLPGGAMAKLTEELGAKKSELNARMKFATKYPSVEEVSDAIGKFGSWFAIVRDGLTDTKRSRGETRTKAARLVAAFADLDPMELTPELLEQLRELIQRHQQSMETLAA